jgi:hypothetical protein
MAPIAHILPTLRVKRSSAPSRPERVVDRGRSRRVHPPDDVLILIRRDRAGAMSQSDADDLERASRAERMAGVPVP